MHVLPWGESFPPPPWRMSPRPLQWQREQERDSQRACLVGSPKAPSHSSPSSGHRDAPSRPSEAVAPTCIGRRVPWQCPWPLSLLPPLRPRANPDSPSFLFPGSGKGLPFPGTPKQEGPAPLRGSSFSLRQNTMDCGAEGTFFECVKLSAFVNKGGLWRQPPAVAVVRDLELERHLQVRCLTYSPSNILASVGP